MWWAESFRQFAEQTAVTGWLWLPVWLRRGRRSPKRNCVASRFRHWWQWGPATQSRGSAQALADILPEARVCDIPGRDHMVAVGDKVFKKAVLEFLSEY